MMKIWKEATIFLISIFLVSSTIALAEIDNLETKKSYDTNNGSKGNYIAWDNGMNYESLIEAIKPLTPPNIDIYPADDFQFENPTYISNVRWIGGYSSSEPETWDWCIDIYLDDGTGDLPGEEISESFCFSWEEITKEEIADGVWEMEVELPFILEFSTDKYWISIYGVGDSPPTSGWGYHIDTIKLKEAVFKSDYYGYPSWIYISKIIEFPGDLCFQLKSDGNHSIDVEKQVLDEDGEWKDCDTENNALDVKIFNDITFRIIIENNGDFPLYDIVVTDVMEDGLSFVSADPEPDDYYHDPPNHYILWNITDELLPGETIEIEIIAHVEGPDCSIDYNYVETEGLNINGFSVLDEDYCYIHAVKKSKTLSFSFLNWLQSNPKLFSLLQLLIQKWGF